MASASTPTPTTGLLTLSGDLLRSIANLLPPTDRVALSQTSKTLFTETWSTFGLADLLARFPFERRLTFPLSPSFPNSPHSLRAVPDRASQQNIFVAISADGRRAAVLPYDNILRLLDTRLRAIKHALPLTSPALSSDVWDLDKGFRRPTSTVDPTKRYAERAAVDPESALEFSADGALLLLSCARFVHIYRVLPAGILASAIAIDVAPVLRTLHALSAPNTDIEGAAGVATLSQDGKTLAWVMFFGFPARAVLTLWAVDPSAATATWTSYTILGALGTPTGSALAWVRPSFHGRFIAVAVNTTRRILRTERVGDAFRRTKLCRFRFYAVPVTVPVPSSSGPASEPALVHPAASSAAWLSFTPATYPAKLATHLRAVVAAASSPPYGSGGGDDESDDEDMPTPRVALNCVHTSPSEATYKALAFGARTRHPWFVAKQPLYSIHLCAPRPRAPAAARRAPRVLVASSAQDNSVVALAWIPGATPASAAPGAVGTTGAAEASDDSDGGGGEAGTVAAGLATANAGRFEEQTPPGRRFAFRGLPWRAAFASVSSFAPGGRWIVGAALQDDECVVCVRNVTDAEYYGSTE